MNQLPDPLPPFATSFLLLATLNFLNGPLIKQVLFYVCRGGASGADFSVTPLVNFFLYDIATLKTLLDTGSQLARVRFITGS